MFELAQWILNIENCGPESQQYPLLLWRLHGRLFSNWKTARVMKIIIIIIIHLRNGYKIFRRLFKHWICIWYLDLMLLYISRTSICPLFRPFPNNKYNVYKTIINLLIYCFPNYRCLPFIIVFSIYEKCVSFFNPWHGDKWRNCIKYSKNILICLTRHRLVLIKLFTKYISLRFNIQSHKRMNESCHNFRLVLITTILLSIRRAEVLKSLLSV